MLLGDACDVLGSLDPASVDLVVTSPPFALTRKKAYGNETPEKYLDWFRPFVPLIRRALKTSGSFVLDIGGAWKPGTPTRSLYHFKLLIMLCDEYGFHLAQEFYWWNPSKLPTPAEWVTVRRLRAKDAVNTVWWLSKTPWPKASNRRVLVPYSPAMRTLFDVSPTPARRPSGHDISENFNRDNGAAIPPNLLAIPNTESNSSYLKYCKENDLPAHPARFPVALPEFFVRMTTNEGDTVVDPFAGSCTTGEACERLRRVWICADNQRHYLEGAKGRFLRGVPNRPPRRVSYTVPRPGMLWNDLPESPLPTDGGRTRQTPARSSIGKQPTTRAATPVTREHNTQTATNDTTSL